jgi:superfamily II DNA or RNA helicase
MKLRLPKLDADYAYISTSLFLPKRHIEEGPIRTALTFGINEEGDSRILVRDHPHHLEVPRAFLTSEQLEELELQVVDIRPGSYQKISLKPKSGFQFRPAQIAAWEALKKAEDGILVMSCGHGKTLMGWMKAALNGGPVLFISWQKTHLAAAEKELHTWLDLDGEVGWIAGDKMEWERDIVFSTIQTLASRIKNGGLPIGFSSRFKTTIYDECHHMAAKHFCLGADLTMGSRLGLTATKVRVDRLEGIYLNHLGPAFYEDLTQDIAPTFFVVDTGITVTPQEEEEFIDVTGERNFPMIRSWLGKNRKRNSVISRVMTFALSQGWKPYALTHSVAQAELLHKQFPGSGCITGSLKKHEDRLAQLHGFLPVFATIQIGGESYNREDLDTLLLLTPFAARDYAAPAFQQGVGRIQRKCAGKTSARVFLFMDSNIEESRGMTRSLIAEAQRQGFEVKKWEETRPRFDWNSRRARPVR